MALDFIPQDIIDRIIDELRDAPEPLKCISLVSKSFLPRSRVHRFSVISLDGPKPAERLWLLLSHRPDLGFYIRDLRVISNLPVWIEDVGEEFDLIRILQSLPRIRSLSLYSSHWSVEWAKLKPAFQATLLDIWRSPNLTSLSLEPLHSPPVQILGELSQLKALTLTAEPGSWYPSLSTPPALSNYATNNGCLRTLKLQCPSENDSQVVDALLGPQSLLSISCLSEFMFHGWNTDIVRKVIEASGDSIEFFLWQLPRRYILPLERVDLAPLFRLRFLLLHLQFYSFPLLRAEFCAELRWLASSLRNSSCTQHLERVVVVADTSFQGPPEDLNDLPEWGELDSVLGDVEAKFAKLHQVHIVVLNGHITRYPTETISDPRLFLRDRFPVLKSRQILLIELYSTTDEVGEMVTSTYRR